MAIILRYFSEFAYLPGVLRKSSRSLSHLLMSSCTSMQCDVSYIFGSAISHQTWTDDTLGCIVDRRTKNTCCFLTLYPTLSTDINIVIQAYLLARATIIQSISRQVYAVKFIAES